MRFSSLGSHFGPNTGVACGTQRRNLPAKVLIRAVRSCSQLPDLISHAEIESALQSQLTKALTSTTG
jgi:hypothetical protein